jgi:hypothetical protein
MIGVSLGTLQGWSHEMKYLEVVPAEMLFMAFTFLAGKLGLIENIYLNKCNFEIFYNTRPI